MSAKIKEFSDDIIINFPHDYLDNKKYLKNLEYLFCVGNLNNTRIITSYMRPLRVTNYIRNKYHISENCDEKELNDKLINIKVGIIRRKKIRGVKINGDYYIDLGTLKSINNINCYKFSTINVLTKDGLEKIKASRVYYLI